MFFFCLFAAFFFADQGYDVYLYNARGSRYSRAHKTYKPYLPGKFWEFSWYELGYYDLPAFIDEVLARTKATSVPCVGHSQGATIILVLLATRPEYNKKVSSANLMAPFTFMDHVGFPISAVLRYFQLFNFRNFEFAPHSPGQETLSEIVCSMFSGSVCNAFINFMLGPSENQRNNVITMKMCKSLT